jgi:FAD/FMN-containing dehydrogenase
VRGGPVADGALTEECLTWIAEFSEALRPFVNGAYVNVPNVGTPDYATAYWGDNVDRLRTIKAKYDPDNVFSFEQGIQPAIAGGRG